MTANTTRPRTAEEVLEAMRGRLVVSCQARPDEAFHGPVFMAAMARSVLAGGAAALRIEGPDDIAAVRRVTDVPIIGLWKTGDAPVYITPTVNAVHRVIEAGADVVALDATGRPRPDGSTLDEVIAIAHEAGALVMADVADVEQGLLAQNAGADLVGSTLSGYVGEGPVPPEPDLDLVEALCGTVSIPVVAEGRISTPEEAVCALEVGAWTVVVGGAITRPASITQRFVAALPPTPSIAQTRTEAHP